MGNAGLSFIMDIQQRKDLRLDFASKYPRQKQGG